MTFLMKNRNHPKEKWADKVAKVVKLTAVPQEDHPSVQAIKD